MVTRMIDGAVLKALADELRADDGLRHDAPGFTTALNNIFKYIRDLLSGSLAPNRAAIRKKGQQVDQWTTKEVLRSINSQQRPTVEAIKVRAPSGAIEAWASDNVALIKSIDARHLDEVQALVIEAVEQGRPISEVTQLLQDRYEVSRSRAKLIARDQIGKLNGDISAHRQVDAGVLRYRWSTSKDERVRESHRDREGMVFGWDDPPPDGHPGEPINCRCVAIAIIEDE